MGIDRWHPILPGEDICSWCLQTLPLHHCPLPWLQGCQTFWKMENPRTSIPELLVASDVQVHWQVCLYLWHVLVDQGILSTPVQWTPSPSDSQCPMRHYKHRLHCQAAQISWSQFCYGHGRLHHQVCSLHRHSDHSLCRWDCSNLPSTHVETPWSPTESSLGLRSSVHGRIHKGTLLVAWNHIGCHHSLPSPRGWPNGMGQPRVGAIPLAVYQSETG